MSTHWRHVDGVIFFQGRRWSHVFESVFFQFLGWWLLLMLSCFLLIAFNFLWKLQVMLKCARFWGCLHWMIWSRGQPGQLGFAPEFQIGALFGCLWQLEKEVGKSLLFSSRNTMAATVSVPHLRFQFYHLITSKMFIEFLGFANSKIPTSLGFADFVPHLHVESIPSIHPSGKY